MTEMLLVLGSIFVGLVIALVVIATFSLVIGAAVKFFEKEQDNDIAP